MLINAHNHARKTRNQKTALLVWMLLTVFGCGQNNNVSQSSDDNLRTENTGSMNGLQVNHSLEEDDAQDLWLNLSVATNNLQAQSSNSAVWNSNSSAEQFAEGLSNSYARLASRKNDICPKLIQPDIDSPRIQRLHEVMRDNHCDYIVYPQVGQTIEVSSQNRQIERLLVTPNVHNFANGGYQVTALDKHVIRLNYAAARRKPKDFTYDVEVVVGR